MSNYTDKCSNINESANIWMHRCNHYGKAAWEMLGYDYDSKKFSDENGCYISVGCGSGKWGEEEYNSVKKSEDKWKEFEKHYTTGSKPRYRHFLYKFFFEFKKDDYIVVPSGGEFHVFQIESDNMLIYGGQDEIIKKRFDQIGLKLENKDDDFKFFRKVKPIRVQIPRKGYAVGELCSKLKYQGTTLEITDDAAKILKDALRADEPFSIYKSIDSLKKVLYDEALNKITPDNLESLIKWYFKKKGADIYDILPKNYSEKVEREDADVLAVFEDLKIRFYVQAKAYKGEVNLNAAQEQLKKYMEYHVPDTDEKYTDIKWIICLAESEDKIKNIDEINKEIRVIHGMEFAEMLLNVGLQNIDEALNNNI